MKLSLLSRLSLLDISIKEKQAKLLNAWTKNVTPPILALPTPHQVSHSRSQDSRISQSRSPLQMSPSHSFCWGSIEGFEFILSRMNSELLSKKGVLVNGSCGSDFIGSLLLLFAIKNKVYSHWFIFPRLLCQKYGHNFSTFSLLRATN